MEPTRLNNIVSAAPRKPSSALCTILMAGTVSAALDLLFACVFYGIRNGITPLDVFHAIATGWFGPASHQMGWTSGIIGILSHFGITAAKPWTIKMPLYRRREPNVQLMEYKCVPFAEELLYGHLRKQPVEKK